MRCYACHRQIKQAYYEQAGKTYGPTCGKRLDLKHAKLWSNPVTKHKFKGVFSKSTLEVQDGQQVLFEGLVA